MDAGYTPNLVRIARRLTGQVRVAVDGKVVQELHPTAVEIQWDVEIGSHAPANFAPEFVSMSPATACFGSRGSGCDFKIEATLRKSGVASQRLCRKVDGGGEVEVLALWAEDKQPAFLTYWSSAGSGGVSNWVVLYWNAEHLDEDARLCLHQERYTPERNEWGG